MNKKIGSIPQLYIRHCYALPSDYAYVAPVVIKKDKKMSQEEILELIASYIDHLKDDPQFITEFLHWTESQLTEAEVLAAMYPHLNQNG